MKDEILNEEDEKLFNELYGDLDNNKKIKHDFYVIEDENPIFDELQRLFEIEISKRCIALKQIQVEDLKEIILKDSYIVNGFEYYITKIEKYAFYGMNDLSTIVLPNTIQYFGVSCFGFCNKLKDIYYNGTMNDWARITFTNDSSSPLSNAKNFFIKTDLGKQKYNNNYKIIDEIILDDELTEIGEYQFYRFKSIRNVKLPNNLEIIGHFAFYECINLDNITIPKSVKLIGDSAFMCCSNLKNINYEGTMDEFNKIRKIEWNVGVPALKVSCIDGDISLVEDL